MTRRRWRKHRSKEGAELNVTPFITVLVVLVSFLLITAVFSRLAIVDMDLPAAATASQAVEPTHPKLALEITIRRSYIEVGDRNAGTLKRFESGAGSYDYAGLGAYLDDVKRQFPDASTATMLLEPDISYDVLVAVMDKVRFAERRDAASGRAVRTELFPVISIGDAPLTD
ncbi:MAG TPA: biopolymer transporter ExbD [Gammaproteobacteria bacterium]|nr:biopolymer transporter ExbD [Gammaproteobacteria bacterium]